MQTNASFSSHPDNSPARREGSGALLDPASVQAKQELLKTASKHLYDCLKALVEATAIDTHALAGAEESAPAITVRSESSTPNQSFSQPTENRDESPQVVPFSLVNPANDVKGESVAARENFQRSVGPPAPPAQSPSPAPPVQSAPPARQQLPPPPPPAPAPVQRIAAESRPIQQFAAAEPNLFQPSSEPARSPFNPTPPASEPRSMPSQAPPSFEPGRSPFNPIPASSDPKGMPSRIPALSPAAQRPLGHGALQEAGSGQQAAPSARQQMPPSPFSLASAPGAAAPSPQKPPFAQAAPQAQPPSLFVPAGGAVAAQPSHLQQGPPQNPGASDSNQPKSPFQPAGLPPSPFQATIPPPRAS